MANANPDQLIIMVMTIYVHVKPITEPCKTSDVGGKCDVKLMLSYIATYIS